MKKYNVSTNKVLKAESCLRQAAEYENEVTTLFDMLMWYMKALKNKCNAEFINIKKTDQGHCLDHTYQFFNVVEQISYDFAKGLVIDTENLSFKPSIIMAGVISVAIELYLKVDLFTKKNINTEKCSSIVLNEI